MKLTHCDIHPGEKAVITIGYRAHLPGARPRYIFGLEPPPQRNYVDLCQRCLDSIPFEVRDRPVSIEDLSDDAHREHAV